MTFEDHVPLDVLDLDDLGRIDRAAWLYKDLKVSELLAMKY